MGPGVVRGLVGLDAGFRSEYGDVCRVGAFRAFYLREHSDGFVVLVTSDECVCHSDGKTRVVPVEALGVCVSQGQPCSHLVASELEMPDDGFGCVATEAWI